MDIIEEADTIFSIHLPMLFLEYSRGNRSPLTINVLGSGARAESHLRGYKPRWGRREKATVVVIRAGNQIFPVPSSGYSGDAMSTSWSSLWPCDLLESLK